ncbi:unnamed protein product [Arctogadus glacialis]
METVFKCCHVRDHPSGGGQLLEEVTAAGSSGAEVVRGRAKERDRDGGACVVDCGRVGESSDADGGTEGAALQVPLKASVTQPSSAARTGAGLSRGRNKVRHPLTGRPTPVPRPSTHEGTSRYALNADGVLPVAMCSTHRGRTVHRVPAQPQGYLHGQSRLYPEHLRPAITQQTHSVGQRLPVRVQSVGKTVTQATAFKGSNQRIHSEQGCTSVTTVARASPDR